MLIFCAGCTDAKTVYSLSLSLENVLYDHIMLALQKYIKNICKYVNVKVVTKCVEMARPILLFLQYTEYIWV